MSQRPDNTTPTTGLILDSSNKPTWRYSSDYFRAKVTMSDLSINEIERRCGLSAGYLHIALGFRPTTTRKGSKTYTSWRRTISYELAERLAVTLKLDYHQAGV